MMLLIMSFFVIFLLIFSLRLIFVFSSLHDIPQSGDKKCESNRTVLAIAGSGGHTTELLRLLASLPPHFTPRLYVVATSDKMSVNKIKHFEENQTCQELPGYQVLYIPRSREVAQSWLSSFFTTVLASLHSVPIVWRTRPDLVLCNGPGTCVPLCFVAFLFKVLGICASDVVFVESICRVTTMSLTGRLLYPFCSKFFVQWPQLQRSYPRALYLGGRIV